MPNLIDCYANQNDANKLSIGKISRSSGETLTCTVGGDYKLIEINPAILVPASSLKCNNVAIGCKMFTFCIQFSWVSFEHSVNIFFPSNFLLVTDFIAWKIEEVLIVQNFRRKYMIFKV